MSVVVIVFGPDPPCVRCQAVKKNVENVAAKVFKTEKVRVEVRRANIASKETIQKYGILVSPALAINGVVKFMGRIPSEAEIEKEVRKTK
ncbi:MAG: thioredoxin family protein [Candidatus Aenigmarchaeota archaeon]|nr:thioredoxin family protein [Candidatus Aenigmarchaeota archaeon]